MVSDSERVPKPVRDPVMLRVADKTWAEHLQKREKAGHPLMPAEIAFLAGDTIKKTDDAPVSEKFTDTLWVEPVEPAPGEVARLQGIAAEVDTKINKGGVEYVLSYKDAYWHGGVTFYRFILSGEAMKAVPLKDRTISVVGPLDEVREKLFSRCEIR